MRKIKISTTIPAFLRNFKANEETSRFSRAELQVFYQGETVDKRLFTEDFSKEIIKSLPYTPVVGYYDEEKEDFIGHATEQSIYGIVDPLSEVVFEVIDGKKWAICDVVLYTERPDKLGKIAGKIVGKQQSLELNPKTLKYVINYDKNKKLKNIEFTKGEFIGLSVLGDKQKPAFDGSHFFTESDFSKKMLILKDYVDSRRGEQMPLEERILNFVELSWGEKFKIITAALAEKYGDYNIWVVDTYDDYVVGHVYDTIEEKSTLMKIFYTYDAEQNSVTLGEAIPVRVVYVEIVEASVSASASNESAPTIEEAEQPEIAAEAAAEATVEPIEESVNANTTIAGNAAVTPVTESTESTEPVATAEVITLQETTNNEEANSNQSTNTSLLTESERRELEDFRRREKISIIDSYKGDLPESFLSKYINEVDNFSKEDLEAELAKEFRKEAKKTSQKTERDFTFYPKQNENGTKSKIEDLVAKYK